MLLEMIVNINMFNMNAFSPEEKRSMFFGLSFFMLGCLMVVLLHFTIGLYWTSHYFIAHFMLGLFLPFLYLVVAGTKTSFVVGIVITSIFHFGYEFLEDQLTRTSYSPDWDQIISGGLGIVFACYVYKIWLNKNSIQ